MMPVNGVGVVGVACAFTVLWGRNWKESEI